MRECEEAMDTTSDDVVPSQKRNGVAAIESADDGTDGIPFICSHGLCRRVVVGCGRDSALRSIRLRAEVCSAVEISRTFTKSESHRCQIEQPFVAPPISVDRHFGDCSLCTLCHGASR